MPEPETLTILTRASDDTSRGDRMVLVSRALNLDVLRERFDDFMSKLQSMVQTQHEQDTGFALSEIQFTAEITADGEFKLLGTGIGVEASSSVTFVLKRP